MCTKENNANCTGRTGAPKERRKAIWQPTVSCLFCCKYRALLPEPPADLFDFSVERCLRGFREFSHESLGDPVVGGHDGAVMNLASDTFLPPTQMPDIQEALIYGMAAAPLSGTWGQPRCITQDTEFVSDRFGSFPVKPGMTGNFVKTGMTGGRAGNDGESVQVESSSFPSDGNDGTELGKQLGEILIGQPG